MTALIPLKDEAMPQNACRVADFKAGIFRVPELKSKG
jgi:hypothetical protein